ncbi:MAG: DUF58 domain-containing protein [Myxococcota bacterium]
MSIYPTRTAAHLAIAGVLVFAAGIALRQSVVVAWGGAILVAVALARTVTLVSVMRIRSAGFEMLWTGVERVKRVRPGEVVTLAAEVRNRDTLAARYDKLRVVASPALETWVEPMAGEVPATGSVKLAVNVRAKRVGHHGIYGLALEVRGAPGLFEVPLTFANPFGIEVRPRALARPLALPQGGRSRTRAMAGRTGRRRGDGTDLRELRERLPGDAFRRIAWKASARRGKLVVKEFEQEERDIVVLVLDASVELWSGAVGEAPLDRAIDIASTLAVHHVGRGDRVGLRIVAARALAAVAPDGGRAHLARLAEALLTETSVMAADRCGWDASDLAVQVTEHLRPLDARAVADLRANRIDKLVERAEQVLSHAPFDRPRPRGNSEEDERLRRYAACFGLHVPPRLEPDRPRTAVALARTLGEVAAKKDRRGRASVVHVIAPPPDPPADDLVRAVRKLRSKGVVVRWTSPPVAVPLPEAERATQPPLFGVVERAVAIRAEVAAARGAAVLRRAGVKLVRRPVRRRPPEPAPDPDHATTATVADPGRDVA